jgi:hypothetical protein
MRVPAVPMSATNAYSEPDVGSRISSAGVVWAFGLAALSNCRGMNALGSDFAMALARLQQGEPPRRGR